jgi:hypothetical protein
MSMGENWTMHHSLELTTAIPEDVCRVPVGDVRIESPARPGVQAWWVLDSAVRAANGRRSMSRVGVGVTRRDQIFDAFCNENSPGPSSRRHPHLQSKRLLSWHSVRSALTRPKFMSRFPSRTHLVFQGSDHDKVVRSCHILSLVQHQTLHSSLTCRSLTEAGHV